MSNLLPSPNREPLPVEDNARKFILEPLSEDFLETHSETSFKLTSDWIQLGVEEIKLAYKEYDDGTIGILKITKTIDENGKRNKVPVPIRDEEYHELLKRSLRRVVKHRYGFTFNQDGHDYDVKYDVFEDGLLHMIEVEGTQEERDAFDYESFPVELFEVSDDPRYTGSEIVSVIHELRVAEDSAEG